MLDTRSHVDEVNAYVNTVHYKSKEMMDALAHIQASDPDSIVILFGDHLPILGPKFAGYVESGFLASTFGDFTDDMYARSTATPLLVIDGQKGPLKLGKRGRCTAWVGFLLDLIAYDRPSMLDLALPPTQNLRGHRAAAAAGRRRQLSPRRPRPGPGDTADQPSEQDAEVVAWLQDVKLIAADIFDGRKYALKTLSI